MALRWNAMINSVPSVDEEMLSESDIPTELGASYYSIGRTRLGSYAARRIRAIPSKLAGGAIKFQSSQTKSEFFERLGIHAEGSFKSFGGDGGGLEVNFAREFKTSSNRIYVTARKQVFTRKVTLVSPELDPQARQLLNQDQNQFFTRYGNKFVSQVVQGGFCFIVFSFTLDTVDEASQFSAHAEAKYGRLSASADLFREVKRSDMQRNMAIDVFSLGVTELAPVPAIGEDEAGANKLIDYFDRFGSIPVDGVGADISYELSNLTTLIHGPRQDPDVSKATGLMQQAVRLNDTMSKQYEDLKTARVTAIAGGIDIQQIEARENRLNGQSDKLEAFVKDLFNRRTPSLPFSDADVERVPASWLPWHQLLRDNVQSGDLSTINAVLPAHAGERLITLKLSMSGYRRGPWDHECSVSVSQDGESPRLFHRPVESNSDNGGFVEWPCTFSFQRAGDIKISALLKSGGGTRTFSMAVYY